MAPRGPQFGFPALRYYAFRLSGRWYRVDLSGVRTLKVLVEIYQASRVCEDYGWLFHLRSQIRQAQALNAPHVLSLVVESTPDPVLRVLAIWLRGRCGGSLGTTNLTKFSRHPDVQTRKEVVRALKRMEAWAQLREISTHDQNARIRRLAGARPSRPYRDRLTDFASRIARLDTAPVKPRLFVSPACALGPGRPPKSSTTIRLILERIRSVLSGGSW